MPSSMRCGSPWTVVERAYMPPSSRDGGRRPCGVAAKAMLLGAGMLSRGRTRPATLPCQSSSPASGGDELLVLDFRLLDASWRRGVRDTGGDHEGGSDRRRDQCCVRAQVVDDDAGCRGGDRLADDDRGP